MGQRAARQDAAPVRGSHRRGAAAQRDREGAEARVAGDVDGMRERRPVIASEARRSRDRGASRMKRRGSVS